MNLIFLIETFECTRYTFVSQIPFYGTFFEAERRR